MQVSHIPEENGEGMQVLHYVNGQKYEPHHDYFHDSVNPQKSNGGQRVATMLMYLTTVEEGGETVFPNSAEKVDGAQWSECAKRGLAVKTMKGDALLFYRLVKAWQLALCVPEVANNVCAFMTFHALKMVRNSARQLTSYMYQCKHFHVLMHQIVCSGLSGVALHPVPCLAC